MDSSEAYVTDWKEMANKLYDVIRVIKPDLMCLGSFEREQEIVREYMKAVGNYKPFSN